MISFLSMLWDPRSAHLRAVFCALAVAVVPLRAWGENSNPEFVPAQFVDAVPEQTLTAPDGLAAFTKIIPPLADRLPLASEVDSAALQSMRDFNLHSRGPIQNGFVRGLGRPLHIDVGQSGPLAVSSPNKPFKDDRSVVMITADGAYFWSAGFKVDGAWRLRLQLTGTDLPNGAQWWVQGRKGPLSGPFTQQPGGENSDLWTPSVKGDYIRLILRLPAAERRGSFTVAALGQLFRLDENEQTVVHSAVIPSLACYQDAQCYDRDDWDNIDIARSAVARLNYMESGLFKICSGGLVADSDPNTDIPYLLTANHCIEDQATASTVEIWWDYTTGVCDGSSPDPQELTISLGSTLLATNEQGDFTLLALDFVPGPRWFLGWDRTPEARQAGTVVHRISHPRGRTQGYSSSIIGAGEFSCTLWPRPASIYQKPLDGLVTGGSSGSPLLSSEALLLGQLSGICGTNAQRTCNFDNAIVDGALSRYWPEVAPWLGAACTYSIQAPTPGSQWPRNSEVPVQWAAEGDFCSDDVRIRLLRDERPVGIISAAAENDGDYLWQVPPGRAAGDQYRIQIEDLGQADVRARSEGDFSIVERLGNPACRYQWLTPRAGDVLERGQEQALSWDSDGASCGGPVRLRLLRNGQPVGQVAFRTADTGAFSWIIPPGRASGERYQLRISAVNGDGISATSEMFSISKPLP